MSPPSKRNGMIYLFRHNIWLFLYCVDFIQYWVCWFLTERSLYTVILSRPYKITGMVHLCNTNKQLSNYDTIEGHLPFVLWLISGFTPFNNQVFHNSRLIRWIQQDKTYKKTSELTRDGTQIACLAVSHSNRYSRMFSMLVWGCNWILFMHGWTVHFN